MVPEMVCPEGLLICLKMAIILIVSCKGEFAQCRTDSDVLCRLQNTGFWRPRVGCLGEKEQVTGENCIMKSFMILSANIISVTTSIRMRWVGHVARMGEKRNVYRTLVGKTEGKRPFGRQQLLVHSFPQDKSVVLTALH
jgi:hypothetical protein